MTVTCPWCGATGLKWIIKKYRWLLVEADGSKHRHQPPKHETE
jgi:hypothetical protein